MEFYKLSGSGNDFIVVDNSDGSHNDKEWSINWSKTAQILCQRRTAIGADGFIVLLPSQKADFRWLFYNADGSLADMCGNGGRCAAFLAYCRGIAGKTMSFETGAGIIDAQIISEERVRIRLTAAHSYQENIPLMLGEKKIKVDFVNTGVPHTIYFVEDLGHCDVLNIGRSIRKHDYFAPVGTNVNFASIADGIANIRTYERGVEDETLACGTGAVAVALISMRKKILESPVRIRVQSGEILNVYHETDGKEDKIYLEGGVKLIYRGETAKRVLCSPEQGD